MKKLNPAFIGYTLTLNVVALVLCILLINYGASAGFLIGLYTTIVLLPSILMAVTRLCSDNS